MKLIRTTIAPHERGLVFRNRGLERVLQPGVYWLASLLDSLEIRVHDLSREAAYASDEVIRLFAMQRALVEPHFDAVELGDREVGIVRRDGVLIDVQRPGSKRLYWRGPFAVKVEVLDIAMQLAVPEDIARLIGSNDRTGLAVGPRGDVFPITIEERKIGLLYLDGALAGKLTAGYHLFWQFERSVSVNVIDLRSITLEVTGQEILTRDRVSLRVNLSATWQVTDPVTVGRELGDARAFVYRELQLVLRRAIGTRSLDELLGDKSGLDEELAEGARANLAAVGIAVPSVGIRDVILPGEMKELLNQVVAAEKSAQANNIRRREETAATRSLLNTAKLMADNPVLMRLKELEALERVTERVDRLTVYGGLDGVMNGLVRIAD